MINRCDCGMQMQSVSLPRLPCSTPFLASPPLFFFSSFSNIKPTGFPVTRPRDRPIPVTSLRQHGGGGGSPVRKRHPKKPLADILSLIGRLPSLKYCLVVLVLHVLLFHYSSEANTLLFNPQHLLNSSTSCPVKPASHM